MRRRIRGVHVRIGCLALITTLVTVVLAAPAMAAPPPPNPSDTELTGAAAQAEGAQTAVSQAAVELAQITQQLDKLEVQTEAAVDANLQAEAQLQLASAEVTRSSEQLNQAAASLETASNAVQDLARNAYMTGNYSLTDLSLMSATGPADLIDRANMLQIVTGLEVRAMKRLQKAKVAEANADSDARLALQQKESAAKNAKESLILVQQEMTNAESAAALLTTKKNELATQLFAAQRYAAALAGQREEFETWTQQEAAKKAAESEAARQRAAAAAAAAQAAATAASPTPSEPLAAPSQPKPVRGAPGGWALPLGGVLTSCYCTRWGTFHPGIDIAAPLNTPIYAAGPGTVLRAGAATGFGQAIYLQHDDGSVTVYGHIETMYVSAGQRVAGGQRIAGVGTRGFSTGPHLHFEVTVGMYGPRTNPVAWLAARGISL